MLLDIEKYYFFPLQALAAFAALSCFIAAREISHNK
jgi:hypothetical protein